MKKVWLLLLCLFLAGSAFAQERIMRFASSVWVDQKGTATVQEDITVWADHQRIRRGIYRDLPDSPEEPLRILSLEMDGQTHPYFTQRQQNMLRVNFGDDHYIPRGMHTYRLRYQIKNAVRFFPQYDEIYWNVTGNDWDFDIEQVSFNLQLPQGACPDEARISSYTGRYGQKGLPAMRRDLFFWLEQPLAPRQGLTVAVPWQKGVVIQPEPGWYEKYAQAVWWIFAGIVLVLLWLYYYAAWKRVGKDPQARILRQFVPPQGFSAAMTGYLYRYGNLTNLLPVVLSSLALKGAVRIEEKKNFFASTYSLILQNKEAPLLAEEEKQVLDILFPALLTQIEVDQANRHLFLQAQERLEKILTEHNAYFKNNALYNWPTFAALGVFVLCNFFFKQSFWLMLVPALILLFGTFLFVRARRKKIAFILLYAALIAGVLLLMKYAVAARVWPLYAGAYLTALSGGCFAFWIQAYTPAGRQKMDEIEGFREYLEIGEGGRVAASDPSKAAQIFCDYLPYAYALGVEGKWIASFRKEVDETLLTKTLRQRGLSVEDMASLDRSMKGLSSATRSCAQQRSSGSGGGGFSGGGSGGGGGGGR